MRCETERLIALQSTSIDQWALSGGLIFLSVCDQKCCILILKDDIYVCMYIKNIYIIMIFLSQAKSVSSIFYVQVIYLVLLKSFPSCFTFVISFIISSFIHCKAL